MWDTSGGFDERVVFRDFGFLGHVETATHVVEFSRFDHLGEAQRRESGRTRIASANHPARGKWHPYIHR